MRYILLFIHALAITIYQFFFVDPVTLKTNFPESVKPGSQFTAEATIYKGALSGFAKFQLELPEGFVAEEADSKGGTFSISGQTLKIIWTSVPSASEITVKVLITVKATVSGDKIIQGKYSYIENNVKLQVEFPPVNIKVSGEAEPVTTTTPTATTAGDSTIRSETALTVSVSRTVVASKTPGVFDVELKVKKDGAKGFAKIQEKIPSGYMAEEVKSDGAAFTFSSTDHIAKIIWASLPATEELVINYKIIPKKDEVEEKPSAVEGDFTYLDNREQKKYVIAKENLPVSAAAEPVVTESVKTETVAVKEPEKTEPVVTEPVKTETVAAKEPVKKEPVKRETVKKEPVKKETSEPVTEVSAPTNGTVMYVVQVGAFKNGVNVNALSRKFALIGVRTEMAEGFTKCIFGNHGEYKSARDSRENTKEKGVIDAFVAAYNGGKRITVQEALMITSQKWYR